MTISVGSSTVTLARLPIVVTRPFTFIGPFQALDAPWAANNFLYSALNDQPLKILGSGESARTYLYGSDMAVLSLHQLASGKTGETYNLGGSEVLSLRELAAIMMAKAGRPLKIRFNTAGRDVGISRLIPGPSEIAKGVKYQPAFSPADAVSRTLAWHDLTRQRRRVSERLFS